MITNIEISPIEISPSPHSQPTQRAKSATTNKSWNTVEEAKDRLKSIPNSILLDSDHENVVLAKWESKGTLTKAKKSELDDGQLVIDRQICSSGTKTVKCSAVRYVIQRKTRGRWEQVEQAQVALAGNKIAGTFTFDTPHNHELLQSEPKRPLTQDERDSIVEAMKEGLTDKQIQSRFKSSNSQFCPTLTSIASIRKTSESDQSAAQTYVMTLSMFHTCAAEKHLDSRGKEQIDFVYILANRKANEIYQQHCRRLHAHNPSIRPLLFIDGTGGIFLDRLGLTLLLGYVYPAHKFHVLGVLIHTGRASAIYAKLFDVAQKLHLPNDPLVVLDFEQAESIGALESFGPGATSKGCWFHLVDAVMSKLDATLKIVGQMDISVKKRAIKDKVKTLLSQTHFAPTREMAVQHSNELLNYCYKEESSIIAVGAYLKSTWIDSPLMLEKWCMFPHLRDLETIKQSFFVIDKNDTNNPSESKVNQVKNRVLELTNTSVGKKNVPHVAEKVNVFLEGEVLHDIKTWTEGPLEPGPIPNEVYSDIWRKKERMIAIHNQIMLPPPMNTGEPRVCHGHDLVQRWDNATRDEFLHELVRSGKMDWIGYIMAKCNSAECVVSEGDLFKSIAKANEKAQPAVSLSVPTPTVIQTVARQAQPLPRPVVEEDQNAVEILKSQKVELQRYQLKAMKTSEQLLAALHRSQTCQKMKPTWPKSFVKTLETYWNRGLHSTLKTTLQQSDEQLEPALNLVKSQGAGWMNSSIIAVIFAIKNQVKVVILDRDGSVKCTYDHAREPGKRDIVVVTSQEEDDHQQPLFVATRSTHTSFTDTSISISKSTRKKSNEPKKPRNASVVKPMKRGNNEHEDAKKASTNQQSGNQSKTTKRVHHENEQDVELRVAPITTKVRKTVRGSSTASPNDNTCRGCAQKITQDQSFLTCVKCSGRFHDSSNCLAKVPTTRSSYRCFFCAP